MGVGTSKPGKGCKLQVVSLEAILYVNCDVGSGSAPADVQHVLKSLPSFKYNLVNNLKELVPLP